MSLAMLRSEPMAEDVRMVLKSHSLRIVPSQAPLFRTVAW